MTKLLEKVIKEAIDDNQCFMGAKEVVNSMKSSKLIILSESIPEVILQKIHDTAKPSKVPTMNFKGSSVTLGRLCGTQFRISALSIKSLSDVNLKSILKEAEQDSR